MSLGIYKPGQGYWTRVMTACMVGLVTLAGAAFVWRQGEVLVDRVLPKSQANLVVRIESGQPTPGQVLDLLAEGDRPGSLVKIGSGTVRRYTPEQQSVLMDSFTLLPERTAQDARRIASPEGTTGGVGAFVQQVTLQAGIEPLYVQGGLATVVLVIGSALGYYLTAMRRKTVDFLVLTDFEMKKVNWSTRREIQGSTLVVIGAGVVISGSLFVFDYLFRFFFAAIGVLPN